MVISRRELNKLLVAAAACAAGSTIVPRAALAGTAGHQAEIFKIAVMTWSFQFMLWKGELKATEVPALVRGGYTIPSYLTKVKTIARLRYA